MAKKPTLVGMYFINSDDEGFRTGRVFAEVAPGFFLIETDNMHPEHGDPSFPLRVVWIEQFTHGNDYVTEWDFFTTPQERQAWLDWIDRPREKSADDGTDNKLVHLRQRQPKKKPTPPDGGC